MLSFRFIDQDTFPQKSILSFKQLIRGQGSKWNYLECIKLAVWPKGCEPSGGFCWCINKVDVWAVWVSGVIGLQRNTHCQHYVYMEPQWDVLLKGSINCLSQLIEAMFKCVWVPFPTLSGPWGSKGCKHKENTFPYPLICSILAQGVIITRWHCPRFP